MKNKKDIVKAIRLTWDSLDSHLDHSLPGQKLKKCCLEIVGNPNFHRKCVIEYAQVIKTLADQL